MAALKVEGTKEWVRTVDIVDPKVEEYEAGDETKYGTQEDADEKGAPEQTQ